MKSLIEVKAAPLDTDEMAAWFSGRVPRRLLAIPFGGPIPSPHWPKGVDYDAETFTERTDIYGPYPELRKDRTRLVDWHHSAQPPGERYGDPTGLMAGAIVGKSILDPDPDEDGWWVDFWLKAGDKRVAMIQRLAERGAKLFGSSQPVKSSDIKHGPNGEITVWPFLLETLTTSPSNTYSVLRPAKAMLEEATSTGIELSGPLVRLLESMRDLDADLRSTSLAGDDGAKAGQALTPEEEDALAELAERTARTARLIKGVRN